jgi:hypothetical protein
MMQALIKPGNKVTFPGVEVLYLKLLDKYYLGCWD